MSFFRFALIAGLSVFLFAETTALAQSSRTGFSTDTSLPLEVSADALRLDQENGTAVFTGSVAVDQGELHLRSDELEVFYGTQDDTGATSIKRMVATGNVKLASGAERAEAQSAVFNVDENNIRMEGDVLLTQGNNLISGQVAVIDLADGSARIEGRVKTVLQQEPASE